MKPSGPEAGGLTRYGALLLAGGMGMACSGYAPPPWSLAFTLGGLALGWVALGVAAWRVPRPGWRETVGWAIAARVPGLCTLPGLEDDFWRYLWDGHLLARLGSPYGVAPAEWFGRTDVASEFQGVLSGINYPDLPTIYGPGVQGLFLISGAIAPGQLWPLKLLLVLAEFGLWCLLRRRLSARGLLLLAWCPLALAETAFHAHFEIWPILLAVAAFCWAADRRPMLAGFALGMAIAARPFAVALLPFFATRTALAPALAGVAAAVGAAYGPVWLAGGIESHGAFAAGWEFNSTGFALLQALLPEGWARPSVVALFAFACLLLWWRDRGNRDLFPRADLLFGVLLLLSPVANPWYALWLLPFAAARPQAWSWALLVAIPLSYITFGNLDGSGSFLHPPWVRPLEVGLVLLAAALARRSGKLDRRTRAEGEGG